MTAPGQSPISPSGFAGRFEVPEIPGAGAMKPPEETTETLSADAPRRSLASKEDLLIEEWIGGKGLDQIVANNLRLLVFSAVSNAIDWDMVGLAKTSFVGRTGKAFQTASISFDRQTTQINPLMQVKLVIPGDLVEPETAAAALQGVLRASKNQFRWEFANGEKMLAAFLDCVETWARSVETQLRAVCQPTPQWNQAAAATGTPVRWGSDWRQDQGRRFDRRYDRCRVQQRLGQRMRQPPRRR